MKNLNATGGDAPTKPKKPAKTTPSPVKKK